MASKTKKDHIYTQKEKNFLMANINKYTYPELAEVFNKTFKTNLTHGNISDVCLKRLKIKRNKPYIFSKGKKDFTSHPIGTEVFDGQYVWIKVGDEYHEGSAVTKQKDKNWAKKHILTYEKYYGAVPKENLVVFLDMNRKNCDIDNLYCTTRTVNFMMAKNGWYSKNKDITLTAIKWCELFYALNE